MGLLDALFGTKTTGATDAATAAANAAIWNAQAANVGTLNTSATNATGDLTSGANKASDLLNYNFGNGSTALQGYGDQAQKQLASGIATGAGTALGGNAAYQPFAASGAGASGLLSDALGVNGAAGNAAATAAFQGSPGYGYQVSQATDAAQRAAAASGMNASGNVLDAVAKIGSNLANQNYSNWTSGLSGLSGQGLTAAAGMSGNNNAAANLLGTGATSGATLEQGTGTNLGILDQALGTAQGNLANNTGINQANIQTGLGSSLVNNLNSAVTAANTNAIGDAKAQDTATNANNGIISNLLKNTASGYLGGGLTGALKGFF